MVLCINMNNTCALRAMLKSMCIHASRKVIDFSICSIIHYNISDALVSRPAVMKVIVSSLISVSVNPSPFSSLQYLHMV